MRFKIALAALAAATVFSTTASAQHSDVLLRSDGTQVLIGAAEDIDMEEGGPFFNLDTTTFEGVFLAPAAPTPPFNFDFERDEPGFFNSPAATVGQNLPGNADVSIELTAFSLPSGTDDTFYWDGTGEVDFQPLSTAQSGVEFTFDFVTPAPFTTTAADGSLDDHPIFGLTGGAADGVYLIGPSVTVGDLDASDPFYMAWLASSALSTEELAEELEEALEVFEEGGPDPVVGGVNFAFFEEAVEFAEAIPEPTSAVLGALALVGLVARRR